MRQGKCVVLANPMPKNDQEDDSAKLNQELLTLQAEAHELSSDNLDRDLAELSHEIEFLDEQVRVDIESYSPEQLAEAWGKIAYLKQRADILKVELDRRNSAKEEEASS